MTYPSNGKLGRMRKGVYPGNKNTTPNSGNPTIISKFGGECARCGTWIEKGEWVRFNIEARTIRHAGRCHQRSSKVSTR